MANSGIIVCGKRYAIDHRVVTFDDEGGYSAYVPHCTNDITKIYASHPAPGLSSRSTRYRLRRLMGPSESLPRLKQVVRQIVVHLDGCRDARMCYNVLHNQRGLSVHFMVDNDGTIYQTLDLMHCAFHAGGVNEVSVGIELQNRGDAARYPNYYKEPRRTVTCRIHGHQFLSYDFTDAQYEGMIRLCRALTRIFEVNAQSPLDAASRPLWTKIDDRRAYRGFVGHYHLSTNKWDPGPFDFLRLFRSMGSSINFPLSAAPRGLGQREDPVLQLKRAAGRYYENSEQDVDLHFPVGPLGRSRLWHGGLHLRGTLKTPVRAVQRGKVVAAKLASPCPVGSCNFVLLRHEVALGRQSWGFFSLYYHLAWNADEAKAEAESIPWLRRGASQSWARVLEQGQVALCSESVEAGETIGRVGEAGPSGQRESQIHFAIFAAEDGASQVDPGYWLVYDEGGRSRFCKDARILRRIDRPLGGSRPDGLLSRRELRNFFRFNTGREELRRVVARHLSEWVPGGWREELRAAPDFAKLPASTRRRLIAQQIEPTLWWTPEVARHAGLPADGMVYSYHPISFLVWLAELGQRTAKLRAVGIENADRWEGKMAPAHLTVDAESGDHMTDAEDFYSGEGGKKLMLEDLVHGYPDDPQ